jgi:RecA-family ATPase
VAVIDLNDLIDKEGEARRRERWQLLNITDLSTPLPPIPWLCEGIGLAPGAISLFAGYGYSRKTMALQSAVLSVATGKPLWGVYSTRKGKTLHLDYEQGERITKERYQRLARGMGFELCDLPTGQLVVANMPRVYLDQDKAVDELMLLCDGVTLVVVDSLRAAFPKADENSSEIRWYLDTLNRVSERTGACLSLIHHARKPNNNNVDGATYAIRGSSALFDACQSVYVFEGAKDTPTTVNHQKDRIRGVTVDSFGLTSEDVAQGGNPRWGLRVTHMEAQQLQREAEVKSEKHVANAVSRASDAIVAFFASSAPMGFSGTRLDVRNALGLRTKDFDAAWAKLNITGVLRREGTLRAPLWRLQNS